MSYTYLLEQVEVYSVECFSDIPQSVLSRLSHTHEKSCSNANETASCQSFPSGTTSEHLTQNLGEEKLISSVEDSLAKTSVVQIPMPKESTVNEVACGERWQESLAKFDHDSSLWKIRQCSLFEDSTECLQTLPKWGMTRNGVLWEQMTWVHLTDANECGFWRTPDTSAGGIVSEEVLDKMATGDFNRPNGGMLQLRLQDQVRNQKLWPTPRAQEPGATTEGYGRGLGELVEGKKQKQKCPTPNCSGMDGGSNSRKANKARGIYQQLYMTPKASDTGYAEKQEQYLKRMGDRIANCFPNLSTQIAYKEKIYPTPKAQDSRACIVDRGKSNLGEEIHGQYLCGGESTQPTSTARLNPNWVEWLMGWPIGWTDLKPLAMVKFHLWQHGHFNS